MKPSGDRSRQHSNGLQSDGLHMNDQHPQGVPARLPARRPGPTRPRFLHWQVPVLAGVLVLRSAGAEPDYVGTWLPGTALTGIGIGLAFPTLGAAAVRDVADDRYATASAVNAAFRQIGAVLGTAILIAIVGDPASLAETLAVADRAYLFAALAGALAGLVTLALGRPTARPAPPATREDPAAAEPAVA